MQKREENQQETEEFKELATAIHLDILKKIDLMNAEGKALLVNANLCR